MPIHIVAVTTLNNAFSRLLAYTATSRALLTFFKGGGLADSTHLLGDNESKAAYLSLKDAEHSSDEKREIHLAIGHLQSAHISYQDIWVQHNTDLMQAFKARTFVNGCYHDIYVVSLIALCYHYLQEPQLVKDYMRLGQNAHNAMVSYAKKIETSNPVRGWVREVLSTIFEPGSVVTYDHLIGIATAPGSSFPLFSKNLAQIAPELNLPALTVPTDTHSLFDLSTFFTIEKPNLVINAPPAKFNPSIFDRIQAEFKPGVPSPPIKLIDATRSPLFAPISKLSLPKANQEQLRQLLQNKKIGIGSSTWNQWRSDHPSEIIILSGADLRRAYLYFANLSKADLRKANLRKANLCGADLSGADLSGANLWYAKLDWVNLRGANLNDANLFFSNITKDQLKSAASYVAAMLPFGMH